jgi:hypothetical protein
MGMGAGYQELDQGTGGVERTGVGIWRRRRDLLVLPEHRREGPDRGSQINMAAGTNGTLLRWF